MDLIQRAARYVSRMPPAVSGSGGHAATFAVAIALRYGFDLSEEEAWPILSAYNERCVPRWTERELRHKLRSADGANRQTKPRGRLRGAQERRCSLPALSILGKKSWQAILAEALGDRAADDALAPAKPAKPAKPPTAATGGEQKQYGTIADIIRLAAAMFDAVILPNDLEPSIRERLRDVEILLNQQGATGRPNFAKSQIESYIIGLLGLAGTHPDVDAMLQRLEAAKKGRSSRRPLSGHK